MKGNILWMIFITVYVSAEDINLCKDGWIEYQKGDYQKSIGLFNQCIDHGDLTQATLAQTYRNMGIVANGSNQSEEALKFYDKAITLNPREIWFDYVNKGNAYSALGQFDEAIESYQMAFAVKPHFNEAYYNLGLVYDKLGNNSEAIKNYQLAVEYGLNSPQLMERVNHHNIQLKKVNELSDISELTEIDQYQPASEVKEVSRLDSYTCQSFVGRGFKAHTDSELIKTTKKYTFEEYGIEFKLPVLPLNRYIVADHLNNTERRVKDSYLIFADDLLGDIAAAVVVTEFPGHIKDQSQLMSLTKGIENSLSGAFNPNQILMRELASEYGQIIELLVYNRGPSPCFPTSEFRNSSPDKETMGISRFIYRDNLMVEFALIVEKPGHVAEADFTNYAREQMNQFWSGLEFK